MPLCSKKLSSSTASTASITPAGTCSYRIGIWLTASNTPMMLPTASTMIERCESGSKSGSVGASMWFE